MKEVLIPLQAYLLGRTGSTVAGLVLLLSLVWWGGPYIGLTGTWSRLGTMIAVVVIAVAWFIGRRILIHRRAGQFKAELQGSAGPGRQVEIQELQQKMDAAIASLKASGVGVKYKGNSALYALPWFLIIGPAAAGKTTLLRNSGLHFPYAQGDDIDIKGFGGTRNCDWWFADEAVLLDTAGRYTTEEDDREEWFAFLGMLRKYRPRTPLNGVIVAVSLVDLLIADDSALEGHVKIIRERLDELIRQLGSLFPVYLVVTKADLLGGFGAFFEDLGEHDRGQAWGTWLLGEGTAAGIAGTFREKLTALQTRLCELRLRKLSMQRNLERKGEIFDFPAQFASASARLTDFFRLLAKENPYQETPRFCGVYLTSGTQEGTPLQRLVGNMRQAFGYLDTRPRAEGKQATRSYFIKKLFQDVIFPNSRDTTRNRKRDAVNRWMKGAWVTAALGAIAASILLFSTSFTSNALLAHRGAETAKELETILTSRSAGPEKKFRAAATVHAHYRQLLTYEERLPLHLLLGIYAGGEQLEPTRGLLLEGLGKSFFRPTVSALEYRIENYGRQWEATDERGREKIREPYYQALKTYLMLVRPERLEPTSAIRYLTGLWSDILRREGAFSPAAGDLKTMQEMVTLYLGRLGKPPGAVPAAVPRDPLVVAARAHLQGVPDGARLYARLRSKEYRGLVDLTLRDLVKGEGAALLEGAGKVPGIFTAQGWRDFIAPAIQEEAASACRGDWVLGQGDRQEGPADPASVARLEKEIRQLYFADYAEAWFSFLEGVRLTSFGSLGEGAKKLQLLGRSDGPIGELMRNVAVNINPVEPAGVPAGLPTPPRRVPELEGAFADLRKLANPAEKMTVSLLLNQYLLSVASVQGEMERLSASADVARESSQFAARVLGGGSGECEIYRGMVATTSLLNTLEPRTRRIASNLMSASVRHAWNAVLGEATRDLQQQWKNVVVAAYARKLRGRFPFASEGSDATLADVADFFRPEDGIFWSFVNTNLAPFITQGRGGWQTKTWLDIGPTLNRQLLVSINRAQAISASLFRRGSDEPGVEFYLYPVPAKGVSETLIVTNGQEYRYRNEPQEWRKFRWPGDAEKLGATVSGMAGRVSRGEMSRDGIWGLFHLLRRARVVQESGTQFLSIWDLEGNNGLPVTVQFRIKADRENNLFDRRVLAGFDVPESIF